MGLYHPKTPSNVGGVLRAAGCYDAALVVIEGQRYHKAPTDVHAFTRHRPLIQVDDLRAAIPHGCIPVAVDLVEGARPLHAYTHPESAFYIFGPEDSTLGKQVLSWCRDVIYVPTDLCMNLAACVNVVLYDRRAKQMRDEKVFRRLEVAA